MEVSGRRATGSQDVVNVCDICMRKRSVSRAALGYCVECREYLCKECYNVHQDPTPCSNHKLLEGNQMPNNRLSPVDMCHIHADEKIIYFCKVHTFLACQKCAFLLHRTCTDVCDISTLSSDPEIDQRYKEITHTIATLGSEIDRNRQTRLNNICKIDSNKKQAKADIKHFCKKIHARLLEIEQTADEEVDKIGEEDMKSMDSVLQECDAVNDDLKIATTELESNQDQSRRDQLFIAVIKATATTEKLGEQLAKLKNDITVREYKFEADGRLKGILSDVEKLGKVSVYDVTEEVSSQLSKVKVTSPLNMESKVQVTSPLNMESKVKATSPRSMDSVSVDTDDGINIETASDTNKCYVTGIAIMKGDTTLAIVDTDNDSVKLVDVRQKKVVSNIYVFGKPQDITLVQPDQLAVTLSNEYTVQFLSVTGTSLSLGRQLQVSGECYGITYSNDRLFVGFIRPTKIQILSMSGSILKTINKEICANIQFTCPSHLTLNVDQSLLYVSDLKTHSIHFMDMNGRVKATCKDQRLNHPSGMAAAEDGSVFVCDTMSNTLYVVSPDCKRSRVLVDGSRGVYFPESVAYSSSLSTLYVGQVSNNTLKVFKLK